MSTGADLQDASPEVTDLAPETLDESIERSLAGEPEVIEPETVLEPLEPPPKWDKRYKEVFQKWNELPEGRNYQEAMLELYNQGQGYTTKVEQERAQLRDYYERMDSVIQPYQQLIAMTGATPDQFIRQAMGLTMQLQQNPRETILRLAQSAGIDLSQVGQDQPYVDPTVKALQQQLQALQQQDVQRQQRQAYEMRERVRTESEQQLNAFASAQDESGQPLHPHLDTVQETMAELIRGREAQRQYQPGLASMTLDEAYERACKLSPEVAQAVESQKAAKEAAARHAKAKKEQEAAKRVTGKKTGADRAGDESLEETIRASMRKAQAA